MTTKQLIQKILTDHPNLTDEQLIFKVWESKGLMGQIGGVATAMLRYFLKTDTPPVASILRYKRMVKQKDNETV